ncbi:MAG: hypothetical protein CVU61_02355 [Deltaproteobacteria bacterium HGW-Deltaproteobacteria-19]|nr:MAG: hypothetical protein CVU61_02355 [Deltaproteobacteria bacterium HGW-Deltaproteobacteria-19]
MKRLIHYLHPILSPLGLFLLLALTWHSTANAVTSDSTDMVQKSYIGFYHRPADPGGLIYWTEKLDGKGGDMSAIIEAFANSTEARARYGTINGGNISAFISQIHLTMFNRDATAEELNFYSNGFNTGRLTSATIMLTVLNNAQGDDLLTINNKLAAANQFTWTVDPELDGRDYLVTYVADGVDFPAARDFLDAVTLDSSTIPTRSQTAAFIQAYIADPGDPVLDSLSPPSTPTDFLIAAFSSSRIDLSWSASTDNAGVTGYKIYRDGAYLISVAGTSTSDTGLAAQTPYCYQVSAFDAAGGESRPSTLACVTTQSDDAVSTTTHHHLLLVYPHTDVEYVKDGEALHYTGSMSDNLRTTVINAFRNLPNLITDGSDGVVSNTYDIVEISKPITKISQYNGNYYWLSNLDIQTELNQFAPKSKYDAVHVVWNNGSIDAYWGLGGTSVNNGTATFSSLIAGRSFWWTGIGEAFGEPFLHEWLHGVCYFYRARGYPMPRKNADGMKLHGYTKSSTEGWMGYYRDLMRGQVWEPEVSAYTGITEAAWKSGNPNSQGKTQ